VKRYPNGKTKVTYRSVPYNKKLKGINEDLEKRYRLNREIDKNKRILFDDDINTIFDISSEDVYQELYKKYKMKNLKDASKRAKDKIYDYAMSNTFTQFATFTFDKTKVNDRYDYVELKERLTKYINNFKHKNKCKDLKYLIVPEQHKDGAWHFHGLFSEHIEPFLTKTDYTNKKGRAIHRTSKGKRLYRIDKYKYNLGFNTFSKIDSHEKVSNYITKYITKDMCLQIPHARRYFGSKNLDKPIQEKMMIEDYEEFIQSLEMTNPDFYMSKPIDVPVGEDTIMFQYILY
jgi:hypothetical protein